MLGKCKGNEGDGYGWHGQRIGLLADSTEPTPKAMFEHEAPFSSYLLSSSSFVGFRALRQRPCIWVTAMLSED